MVNQPLVSVVYPQRSPLLRKLLAKHPAKVLVNLLVESPEKLVLPRVNLTENPTKPSQVLESRHPVSRSLERVLVKHPEKLPRNP